MLTREWPESVERVAQYLREAGAEARIEEFTTGTPTAKAAAEAVGCDLAQIVKSIVFDCDGGPVVALVPGDRRADPEKVRQIAACREIGVASATDVASWTGFEPGAVAPFPLPLVERVFAEATLLSHEVVWIGAGSPRHLAGLAPTELMRLARAETAVLT